MLETKLPTVPFQVPIIDMTPEEYREYLAWRIEIQMVAIYLDDWKKARLEDKEKCKKQIWSALISVNHRAQCFPMQPIPMDLVDPIPASGRIAQSAMMDVSRLQAMMRELTCLFMGATMTVGTTKTDEIGG